LNSYDGDNIDGGDKSNQIT